MSKIIPSTESNRTITSVDPNRIITAISDTRTLPRLNASSQQAEWIQLRFADAISGPTAGGAGAPLISWSEDADGWEVTMGGGVAALSGLTRGTYFLFNMPPEWRGDGTQAIASRITWVTYPTPSNCNWLCGFGAYDTGSLAADGGGIRENPAAPTLSGVTYLLNTIRTNLTGALLNTQQAILTWTGPGDRAAGTELIGCTSVWGMNGSTQIEGYGESSHSVITGNLRMILNFSLDNKTTTSTGKVKVEYALMELFPQD